MFSVAPSLATNASAAFNPYLGPVSPGLVPAEILPTAPMLVAGNPGVPVPAAAAAAAQKLMRTDRLEVGAARRDLPSRVISCVVSPGQTMCCLCKKTARASPEPVTSCPGNGGGVPPRLMLAALLLALHLRRKWEH